jgi:hypothetical protein
MLPFFTTFAYCGVAYIKLLQRHHGLCSRKVPFAFYFCQRNYQHVAHLRRLLRGIFSVCMDFEKWLWSSIWNPGGHCRGRCFSDHRASHDSGQEKAESCYSLARLEITGV